MSTTEPRSCNLDITLRNLPPLVVGPPTDPGIYLLILPAAVEAVKRSPEIFRLIDLLQTSISALISRQSRQSRAWKARFDPTAPGSDPGSLRRGSSLPRMKRTEKRQFTKILTHGDDLANSSFARIFHHFNSRLIRVLHESSASFNFTKARSHLPRGARDSSHESHSTA